VLSASEAFLVLDGLGTDNHTRTTGPVVSIDRSGARKVKKSAIRLSFVCFSKGCFGSRRYWIGGCAVEFM
jgi:hypothetical protein